MAVVNKLPALPALQSPPHPPRVYAFSEVASVCTGGIPALPTVDVSGCSSGRYLDQCEYVCIDLRGPGCVVTGYDDVA